MKVAYPVIFTEVDTNFLIEVPDLGILTEANEEGKAKGTIADAMMMARDAIGLACINAEDEGRELAEPSKMSDIDIAKGVFAEEGSGTVSLVDVDLLYIDVCWITKQYGEMYITKLVKSRSRKITYK